MMRLRNWVWLFVFLMVLPGAFVQRAAGQATTANLSGRVLDPSGAAVSGAKLTVTNVTTSQSRVVESDSEGRYQFVGGLPPGRYQLKVEAQGFSPLVNSGLELTIGQQAVFDANLELAKTNYTTIVTESAPLVETERADQSNIVNSRSILNLPINGRNYIDFTRLTSQATRDNAPFIGPAPGSGLNLGGQRGKSVQVNVDGADQVDNSVNGIRSTVSQEGVQEFDVLVNNFMPEYGRAIGGVINIVTKGGGNEVHGNVFGFLRHKSIQARNPFSVAINSLGNAIAVKQPFTRVQAGATIGGPIVEKRTFYFLSFETTRRQETGFNSIGQNNFGGLVPTAIPAALIAANPLLPASLPMSAAQAAFINSAAPVAVRAPYAALAGFSSAVARGGVPGVSRFPTSGATVPLSWVALDSLRGNFPVSEGTSLWSARLDHYWDPQQKNTTFVRVNVSPSLVTGIQVNAQNQSSGANAGSRTSLQQYRDLALIAQHVSTFSAKLQNTARFQYARRGLHYGFSQLAGGSNVAVDILGFASFGREPFSSVDRIERRFQWSDNLSWIKGHHTFKFGADFNLIQIRSNTNQVFQLDFGGLYRFGQLTASQATGGLIPNCLGGVGPACTGGIPVPPFNAVQAYGLGLPGSFLQGVGQSGEPFDNKPLAFFAQDSWKIHPRLTLNYGVRYDVEFTPRFTPASAINTAAEAALGVIEGLPTDKNNVAPRFGLAWDPRGDQKSVVRAGYGLFYDHPLLAVAFNAATADGARSVQLQFGPGAPSASALTALNATGIFNASSIFQGILNTVNFPSLGFQNTVATNPQRFNSFLANSFFTNQNFLGAGTGLPLTFLPFTFPVVKNFEYGIAQQGNLAFERQFAGDLKISLGYSYIHATHLNRARNINATDPAILVRNADIAVRSGLTAPGTNPLLVGVPLAAGAPPAGCPPGGINTAGGGSIVLAVPGVLASAFGAPGCAGGPIGFVGTPALFNFFRPSGPNPTFVALNPVLTVGFLQTLAATPGVNFPVGPQMGLPIPFGDVDAQESSGSSIYHGLTVSVSKKFSRNLQFLSSYTWSHAIDDSTDLQSPLAPQDNRNARAERGNSTFDQRHRWVTSGVFESPFKQNDSAWAHKFFANFTVSTITEVASGRPFNILTGTDFNLDFGPTTDRPSVVPAGTPGSLSSPFLPGVSFTVPTVCANPQATVPSPPLGCTGNLRRNAFARPGFFSVDLRIARKFHFGSPKNSDEQGRWNLEVISEAFNLLNRFNVADVNQLCDPTGAGSCRPGEPTAALDPRQFQFALKINW